ncbi:MAG: 4Fe-4S dicluster domain-containing protein [Alphaproteobacteria bacterium]|nr:4Fe-4S dicluster domain-containing protein [Alphaproteobacteria bacterium]
MSAGSAAHAIPPFKERLREALESESLPVALGRSLPQLSERRNAAFSARDFEGSQADLGGRRQAALDRMPELIEEFTAAAEAVGTVVHGPTDAAGAVATALQVLHDHEVQMVVKSKSMATEEIQLNAALEDDGIEVVETDLGEFLVQVAGERPSHIVAPALHIVRERAAELISRATGEDLPPDPDVLVGAAARHLRSRFIEAGAGITGANALVAATGTVMLVCNEGNTRLASALPPVHIVIAGIDKLVPTLADATTMLESLPRSATGQPISTYVSFISGPSRSADIELSLSMGVHGPRHVHIVLLDNGREAIRTNPRMRSALQCVRCGACSNVCPVYQQVGGHAMGHIYTGPIGLLVTPYHHGLEHVEGPQSLCASCGACASVCPAGIPIHDLIQDVREWAVAEGHSSNTMKKRALGALADERLLERGARLASKAPWLQALGRRLPGSPLKRLPLPNVQRRPFRDRIGELTTTRSKIATRVAYFPGCLTDWLSPETGEAAVAVLEALGFAVEPVPFSSCCGLPAINAGYKDEATQMMRQTVKAIEQLEVDAVVSTSTSCAGAMLHDYARLSEDDSAWAERARVAAAKVRDFTSFVAEQGIPDEMLARASGVVTIHDACQSKHGLGLGPETRELLTDAGYTVVEAPPSGECCGFGGSFSFDHPEVARRMRARKLEAFATTGAEVVCVDNPGCLMHLKEGPAVAGAGRPVHLAELLRAVVD